MRITDDDSPQARALVRAQARRRLVLLVVASMVLFALLALVYAGLAMGRQYPDADRESLVSSLAADGVWIVSGDEASELVAALVGEGGRPAYRDALASAQRASHGWLAIGIYDTGSGIDPAWVAVVPVRRPQRMFTGALERAAGHTAALLGQLDAPSRHHGRWFVMASAAHEADPAVEALADVPAAQASQPQQWPAFAYDGPYGLLPQPVRASVADVLPEGVDIPPAAMVRALWQGLDPVVADLTLSPPLSQNETVSGWTEVFYTVEGLELAVDSASVERAGGLRVRLIGLTPFGPAETVELDPVFHLTE